MTQPTPIPGMLAQWATSHIAGGNAEYVDALYEHYLQDPNAIPPEWRDYFDQLPRVASDTHALHDVPHSVLRDRFARISKMRVRTDATVAQDSQATEYERKQVRVVQLISAYRQRGGGVPAHRGYRGAALAHEPHGSGAQCARLFS